MVCMTTAAIYARISDDRDGTAAGVTRQVDDCTRLIESNRWNLTGPFVDNDRSAYNGKSRPEWDRLKAQVEAGAVDVVVAYSADRLTRHPRELEDLVDLLESSGTKVATVTSGEYNLDTADGRAIARIHGTIARQSSEKASERIKRAQRQAAASGRPHGGRRRFGYSKDGRTINHREAEVIRQGAADVLAGVALAQVARDWNAAGVLTPKGRDWNSTTVRDVLDNPRLAGFRTYQGKVVGAGDWPAIIDEATHRALLAVFDDPDRKQRGAPTKSLLGGLLRCGSCGTVMHQQRRSKDNAPLYSCDRRNGCGNVSGVAHAVDRVVSEAFLALLTDPDNLAMVTAETDDNQAGELSERLAVLDQRERALGARLAAGELTDLVLQGALAEIGKERADVTGQLRAAATQPQRITPGEVGALVESWDDLDREGRRAAIEVVVDSVTIAPVIRPTGNRFDADRVTISYA